MALKSEQMGQAHECIYRFDTETEKETPTVFPLLLLTKICLISGSFELALSSAKKVLAIIPKCSYALYICGLLLDPPENKEQINDFLDKVTDFMQKVVSTDPNYWEPLRMLAKISVDRSSFSFHYLSEEFHFRLLIDEAMTYFHRAIDLVRKKDELECLLKEKLVAEVTGERIQQGRPAMTSLMELMPK